MNKIKELTLQQKIVELFSLIVSIMGVVTSVKMNLVGRSLWFDEAALAYSFVTRSFGQLTKTGLDLVQSAPVGWLYLEKIFCAIFGYSDFAMRVLSIVFYCITLLLIYLTMKLVFHTYYKLPAVAFTATIPLMLQYSNVFKPYIFDCVVALIILLLFYYYGENRLKWYQLAVLLGLLVWFSSPACFVSGGMLASFFLYALFGKNKSGLLDTIKTGLVLGVSFIIYYFYWLSKVPDGMVGFWGDRKFPLIPTSMQDLKNAKWMIENIFCQFHRFWWLFIILFFAGIFYAFYKKNKILVGIYATFFLSAFASFIGKYPVNKRLWLFAYPLIVIVVFVQLNELICSSKNVRAASLYMSLIYIAMILLNSGIYYYWNDENVYWPGYEVKGQVEYMLSEIEDGDRVYVNADAKPIFLFYNHYQEDKIYGRDNEVVIGEFTVADERAYTGPIIDHTKEFEFMMGSKTGKCYVITGSMWDEPLQYDMLYKTLKEAGSFEIIFNKHNSPLWCFTNK